VKSDINRGWSCLSQKLQEQARGIARIQLGEERGQGHRDERDLGHAVAFSGADIASLGSDTGTDSWGDTNVWTSTRFNRRYKPGPASTPVGRNRQTPAPARSARNDRTLAPQVRAAGPSAVHASGADPMSRCLDDDQTTETGQEQSFLTHLVELRQRLVALGRVVIVFAALTPFAAEIFDLLSRPMMAALPAGSKLLATGVTTPFMVPLKGDIVHGAADRTAVCAVAGVGLRGAGAVQAREKLAARWSPRVLMFA
jgi:hypothetical protein